MKLHAEPICDAFGATVTGVSAQDVVDPAVAAEIGTTLGRYSVLVFPELYIGDDDLVTLSRSLGTVVELPHGAIAGHPEIMPVSHDPSVNRLAAVHTANDYWHTDGTSYERPDKATFLAARRAPDTGEGGTEFASTYAAYEALPPERKDLLDGLQVQHTFASSQRKVHPEPTEKQLEMWARIEGRVHPLVWYRDDGRTSLLIGSTAERIVGLPDDDGRALLDELLDWVTQPRFTFVHEWRPGDLVIFDNTGLLHRSLPYRATSPRLLHRTTLSGQETTHARRHGRDRSDVTSSAP